MFRYGIEWAVFITDSRPNFEIIGVRQKLKLIVYGEPHAVSTFKEEPALSFRVLYRLRRAAFDDDAPRRVVMSPASPRPM